MIENKTYILLAFLLSYSSCIAQDLLGPMLGHVTDNKASIWCETSQVTRVVVRVGKEPSLVDAREIVAESFQRGVVELDQLEAGVRYFYKVTAGNHRSSDVFSFMTAPVVGAAVKLRLIFSSCSGRDGLAEEAAWELIAEQDDCQIILQLGDNHYGNTTNADLISQQYRDHRASIPFKQASATMATYGIWDDHDYGPNNSDGTAPGKEDSLAVFKSYWANPSYGEATNPGIYYSFYYGDVQIIMLDSRYHRTPNNSMAKDDPNKTMLGREQLLWLETTLKESHAKVKLIACGSDFQLGGTNDGFAGFEVEQKKILDWCRDVTGVILLSGDRHFTAAYQNRGETIEISSGPLGSRNYNAKQTPDLFFHENEGKMFSILDIDTTSVEPKISVEVYQVNSGKIYDRSFTWGEINGEEKIAR